VALINGRANAPLAKLHFFNAAVPCAKIPIGQHGPMLCQQRSERGMREYAGRSGGYHGMTHGQWLAQANRPPTAKRRHARRQTSAAGGTTSGSSATYHDISRGFPHLFRKVKQPHVHRLWPA